MCKATKSTTKAGQTATPPSHPRECTLALSVNKRTLTPCAGASTQDLGRFSWPAARRSQEGIPGRVRWGRVATPGLPHGATKGGLPSPRARYDRWAQLRFALNSFFW